MASALFYLQPIACFRHPCRQLFRLPSLHIFTEFIKIRFFQLLCGNGIAEHQIIKIHQHIAHLFHKMRPDRFVLHDLPIPVFLDNIRYLTGLADHPQQRLTSFFRGQPTPFFQIFLLCMHLFLHNAYFVLLFLCLYLVL